MSRRMSDLTPCGVMFDVLKRRGGISHKELASIILSERPLADGRSPQSRASDRTWVSRFVVHAPVSAVQQRYFRDCGVAAQRIMNRLRASRSGAMSCDGILDMVCGEQGAAMVRALEAAREDVRLYQNALVRMRDGEGYTSGERAEAALVLFVAVGCTAKVGFSVDYAMRYIGSVMGGRLGTPTSCPVSLDPQKTQVDVVLSCALGFVRVVDGVITSEPYWVSSSSDGVEIGALATGEDDITDVDEDVSAHHARVWHEVVGVSCDGIGASCDASNVQGSTAVGGAAAEARAHGVLSSCGAGRWLLEDLGSSNGTVVVDGAGSAPVRIKEGEPFEIHPGDEVRLGSKTTFILVEGTAEMAR